MKCVHAKTLTAVALLLGLLAAGLFAAAEPLAADDPPPHAPDASTGPQAIQETSVLTGDVEVILESEPSVADAVAKLEAGELSIYASPIADPDLAQQIETSPNLESHRSYGTYNELTFNPVGPEFNDGRLNPFSVPRIREAMNYLVDRTYIANGILGGMAVPRYTPINYASKDRTVLADQIAAIQLQYAYDKDRAAEIVAQEMESLGAEMVTDTWTYEGEPVELIGLIRSEDKRTQMGDYFADQLEDLGFGVQRQHKTSSEASQCWTGTDPHEGCFHFYTGGWVSTSISRDAGGDFSFFYTPDGLPGIPLWDNYAPTPEFYQLARDLVNSNFSTVAERNAMMAQALQLAMEDSVRIWLITTTGVAPYRKEIDVAADLSGSIYGSQLWAQTLQCNASNTTPLTIALPNILVGPWNPIAGTNWVYDTMGIRGTQSGAVVSDPYTGLQLPMQLKRADITIQEGLPVDRTLDWVTLTFTDSITVPDDAWADWDADNQRFITAGEKYSGPETVKSKVVMHYKDDFFDTVKWHDGSPYTIADFVMFIIMQFDRAKTASSIYDESYVQAFNAFMSAFRGWRIVNEDPFVIEYYTNAYALDAENNVSNFRAANPAAYGEGAEAPWHTVALGWHAEASGQAAFSAGKADKDQVPHMDYIRGPTLNIMKTELDAASPESFMPYTPTLGQYITTTTPVSQRLTNLTQWYDHHGHFWVGTGPLYLKEVITDAGRLVMKPHPDYPSSGDNWDEYTDPPIADISVNGPSSFERGEKVTYTVEVTLDGNPYPASDIEAVHYLVVDSQDEVRFSGEATQTLTTGVNARMSGMTATTDGRWYVILSPEMTQQLPPGPSRLQIAVSSKRVVIPSFEGQSFTAPDAEIFLPVVLRQP